MSTRLSDLLGSLQSSLDREESLDRDDVASLLIEVHQLVTKGTPGVIHDIDKAFCDLVVLERDYERQRNERLMRLVDLQRETIEKRNAAS